jgi:histidine triad (HIT) family protein
MSDCVFCRIVRGELPCAKLYEDDEVLAFMDIAPIIKGHALVIPKHHIDPLTAVPEPLLGQVLRVVQRIAAAQMSGLRANGFNVHQSNGACAGQVVPHVHFHIIPRFEQDGHRWNWNAKTYDSPAELLATAEAIRHAID